MRHVRGLVAAAGVAGCLCAGTGPGGVDLAHAQPLIITHFAGSAGGFGSADGPATVARFKWPNGIAIDASGNLYVTDTWNATIRRVTPQGVVTTLAGTPGAAGHADGMGSAARFNEPGGIAVGNDGTLYVADTKNHAIRKVTPAGVVTTLAGSPELHGDLDGTGEGAQFEWPWGITIDPATSTLFVTDAWSESIRKVTASGVVTTVYVQAQPPAPRPIEGAMGILFEPSGTLLVSAAFGNVVVRITQDGVVTPFVGGGKALEYNGQGASATFFWPHGLARDANGTIYVADTGNGTIRRVTPDGTVTTLAGGRSRQGYADGPGNTARFDHAVGIVAAPDGVVYVADAGNHVIRRVGIDGTTTTIAGVALERGDADGIGSAARFEEPQRLAVDAQGNVYLSETSACRIRKVTPGGVVSTLVGQWRDCRRVDGPPGVGRLQRPDALAVNDAGVVFVADLCTIRAITPDGAISTVAGSPVECGSIDGTGAHARLRAASSMTIGPDGMIYFPDRYANSVRRATQGGVVSTFAGGNGRGSMDGPRLLARFDTPVAVAFIGTDLYVAGFPSATIRRISATGLVDTITGWAWPSASPYVLASAPNGSLYVTSMSTSTITQLIPGFAPITVAGTFSVAGKVDGMGSAARLSGVSDIAVGADGTVYVAEHVNHDVRKGTVANLHILSARASAGGSVTSDPAGIVCGTTCVSYQDAGVPVTLTAHPLPGHGLLGWSGSCSGAGTCTLPMTANAVVAATFVSCVSAGPQMPIVLAAEGGVVEVPMFAGAGCQWTVTSPAPWLTTASSGTGNGILTLTATRNDSDAARTTDVSTGPSGDGTPMSYRVTQAGRTGAGLNVRYLAEGATSDFLSTRLALFNPSVDATDAVLTFSQPAASPITTTVPVPSRTRTTVDPTMVPGLDRAEFSTLVESTRPLVVDRTMWWDSDGYGAHAETAVAAPSTTWYLAEGATHSGFDLFYLLQNPNPYDMTVHVTYLLPNGPPLWKTYDVPAMSRRNIWVNAEDFEGRGHALSSTDVSAIIEGLGGVPLIVERAMYLSNQGRVFDAGHESAGVTTRATRWFLAEGNTGPYFDLYVLLANPDAQDAHVTVTYLLTDGRTYERPLTVKARSRASLWVDIEQFPGTAGYPLADVAVSTTVVSDNAVPIIVERALWWPGSFDSWYEGHNSAGSPVTGTSWAIADGEVGGASAVETYVLIANTSSYGGIARVTVYLDDGTSQDRTYSLPARSRTNVSFAAEFGAFVENRRFSATIESVGAPLPQIVVERAMYWNAGGVPWAAGTNALATRLQ